MKMAAEEQLEVLSPGFVHQMSECLDCRACAAVCPSGVQYGKLVEHARAEIERAQAPQRSPLQRAGRWFAIRALFGNLTLIRVLAWWLGVYQRFGLQRLCRASGIVRLLHLDRADALLPRISRLFFSANDQRFEVPEPRAEVFLHTGCIMPVAFAQTHEATVRVLNRAQCDVVVPRSQGCCGAIAVHAGDAGFGRRLAKQNIAAFERSGARYYIVNAAGCGSALKEYGDWLADDPQWAQRAAAFSSRVRDILEFLDAAGIPAQFKPLNVRVTYQEPCHLVHAQRISAAPRRLLTKIPGLTLAEMAESSVCCGSAGVYNLTQPEMSGRLGSRKARNAAETAADVVLTANPGCALQLDAHLRMQNASRPVKHVVELLDESLSS